MKVKDLRKQLNDAVERIPRYDEYSIRVALHDPSMGPISMATVDGGSFGFDWESDQYILHTKERITSKSKDQDLLDTVRDTMYSIYVEAYKKKRRPWYFDRLESVYRRLDILDIMRERAQRDMER